MVDIFNTRLFYVADGDKLHAVRVARKKLGWFGSTVTVAEEEDVHDNLIKRTGNRARRIVSLIKTGFSDIETRDRAFRATRARAAAEAAIHQVMFGSAAIPSAIQKEGEKALSGFTRKTIEIVHAIGRDQFHEIISRNIAQLLIFAQAEASGNNDLKNQALPVGTKFFFHRNDESAYIIEEAPRVRPIIWDGRTVRLSFPYCVFVIKYKGTNYQESRFYFRNATITQGSDRLFLAPLPDLNNDGAICYPSDMGYPQGGPAEVANTLQTTFWNSNFRSEHWGRRIGYPIGLTAWSEITKKRATDILKQEWIQAPQRVETWYLEDPVGQVNRLQQHAATLAQRIGTNIGEMILQKLTVDDLAQERVRFSEVLKAAVKSANLPARIEAATEEHLKRLMAEEPDLPDPFKQFDTIDRSIANGVATDMGEL